jgi:hypothetical protein
MKTIKEAAREHSGSNSRFYNENEVYPYPMWVMTSNKERAFEEGVKFAQRWTSTEEESPPELSFVLVRTESGKIKVGRRYGFNYFYDNDGDDYYGHDHVTHWRVIEFGE